MKRIKRNFELILILGTFLNLIFLGFISIGTDYTLVSGLNILILGYAIIGIREVLN